MQRILSFASACIQGRLLFNYFSLVQLQINIVRGSPFLFVLEDLTIESRYLNVHNSLSTVTVVNAFLTSKEGVQFV